MASTPTVYRCTILAAGSAFTPGQAADPADTDFWVTSFRDSTRHNYITAPPEDDGDRLDLLTSHVTDGACQVSVSDVYQGGGIIGTPTTVADPLTGDTAASGWVGESAGGSISGSGSTASGAVGPDGGISQNIAAALLGGTAPYWVRSARTFTSADGIAANTTYTVVVVARQKPRTSPDVLNPTYGIQPWVTATAGGTTTEAYGLEFDASGADPAEPWRSLTVTVTTGADATLRVTFGWYSLSGGWFFGGVEFDSVSITQVVSPGLSAGRYVTLWLADTDARQQMLGREAYVEQSTDDGATWTIVRHGYVTDIELPYAQVYVLTIGGTRRRERNATLSSIFRLHAGAFSSTSGHLTAILGGPIANGMPGFGITNLGFPTFEVTANASNSSAGAGDGWVAIEYRGDASNLPPYRSSYPYRARASGAPTDNAVNAINAMTAPFFVDGPVRVANPSAPFGIVALRGGYPGIAIALVDPAALSIVAWTTAADNWQNIAPQSKHGFITAVGSGTGTIFLQWAMDNADTLASVGTQFAVLALPLPLEVERFPVYYMGHPVDVAAEALQALGATVDATAKAATKAALGSALVAVGTLTDADESVADWVERLGAAYGFAVSLAADGTSRRFFTTRDKSSWSGATVIDSTMLRSGDGPTYQHSDSQRRNQMRYDTTQFLPWTPDLDEPRPYSDLVSLPTPLQFVYSADGSTEDEDDYGTQAERYNVSGCVATIRPGATISDSEPPVPYSTYDYFHAAAQRLFDRHGRGAPEYTIALTGAAGVAPELGEVVVLDLPHVPNAQPGRSPTSQRSGPRPARVVSVRHEPNGPVLTCVDEDSGTPLSVAFTIDSVTALADVATPSTILDPSALQAFAEVTMSGFTALAAVGAKVNLYLSYTATGVATAPTDSGVLIKTVDSRLYSTDTVTLTIGPLCSRQLVTWWISARAWVDGGGISSPTYWYSENGPDSSGTPIDPGTGDPGTTPPPTSPPTLPGDIASLNLTPDTNWIAATWTNTDTTYAVRVRYQIDGAAQWTVAAAMLAPGTLGINISPLAPETDYDIEVTMIDASGTPVGTLLTGTTTTLSTGAGTPVVLTTPLLPRAYSGFDPTLGVDPAAVGMMVRLLTVPYPHHILFEMTPETALGSGVPRAWPSDPTPGQGSSQQTRVAVPGDISRTWFFNPGDNLRRFMRAKAIDPSGNFTDSGWTAVVEASPYGYQALTIGQGLELLIALNVDGVGATGVGAASQTGTITLHGVPSMATAFRFDSNEPVRVRLYSSTAARTADLTRVIGDAYASGAGLLFEAVITNGVSGSPGYWIAPSPNPVFGPSDSSQDVTIYYTLASLYPSGTPADVVVFMQYTVS